MERCWNSLEFVTPFLFRLEHWTVTVPEQVTSHYARNMAGPVSAHRKWSLRQTDQSSVLSGGGNERMGLFHIMQQRRQQCHWSIQFVSTLMWCTSTKCLASRGNQNHFRSHNLWNAVLKSWGWEYCWMAGFYGRFLRYIKLQVAFYILNCCLPQLEI